MLDKKRYLVIGGSGFIGRNICEYLQKQGYDVTGTYFSNSYDTGITYQIDLTKYESINTLLKLGSFDYVIMSAAKTYGINISATTPEVMVRENIIMNVNVLDACLKNNINKVLYISSSTVYQDSNKILQEDDLDLNFDPYPLYLGVGWVKRYTEQLCKFYHSRGLNCVVVRPTNIYGKYDSYTEDTSHFIPAIVKRAIDKQNPFKVWGNGNVMKDYIYIDDFVRDVLDLLEIHNTPDPINICSGKVYTVKEAVDIILRKCSHKVAPEYDKSQLDSVPMRLLSKKKLTALLGLREYQSLITGIDNVIEWIKSDMGVKLDSVSIP